MDQPQFKHMDIRNIYEDVVLSKESGWLQGCSVPRHYYDCHKMKTERQALPKKQKPITKEFIKSMKRQHFINDVQKHARAVPGPGDYKFQLSTLRKVKSATRVAVHKEEKKEMKVAGSNITVDFFDDLRRKKKSTIPHWEGGNYIEGLQQRGANIPGPGSYNPHGIMKKLKVNKSNPESEIDKQKKLLKKEKAKVKAKAKVQVIEHPYPIAYSLFGHQLDLKHKFPSRNYMGSKKREEGERPKTPGPGHYSINNNWLGKQEGMKRIKSAPWFKNISKGTDKSIYY